MTRSFPSKKFAIAVSMLVLAACSRAQLGLPRVASSSVSPNGLYVVELRNEPTIDPPEQSLWLGRRDGGFRKLAGVASDSPPWKGPGAWSPDSSLFAFAVSTKLVVVESATATVRHSEWLIPRTDFTRRAASGISRVEFDAGSSAVIVELCGESARDCGDERLVRLSAM